jgi:hypothetical protein
MTTASNKCEHGQHVLSACYKCIEEEAGKLAVSVPSKVENKNRLTLMSFVNYCATHPEQRFWQALRNWVAADYILVQSEGCPPRDTFYFEGKHV